GEVAGMDEAVVPRAHHDAACDFVGARSRADAARDLFGQACLVLERFLAPPFRRTVGQRRAGPIVVRQSACHRDLSSPLSSGNGSDAKPVPHTGGVAPALKSPGELAEVLGQLDLERDQLVAAAAALRREALAFQA